MVALARHPSDRLAVGVCGGLAAAWGIDALWLRLAFVVATLGMGVGVALYVIVALLMLPPDVHEPLTLVDRLRLNARLLLHESRELGPQLVALWRSWRRQRHDDKLSVRWRALAGGTALLIGLTILLASLDLLAWLTFWRTVAVLLILVGVGLAASRRP